MCYARRGRAVMVGVLGPFEWSGSGTEVFSVGWRVLAVDVYVFDMPTGAHQRGPLVPALREIGAWSFRAFVNSFFALGTTEVFSAWHWIEREKQRWEFKPDVDMGYSDAIQYAIYPGGEVRVLVWVA